MDHFAISVKTSDGVSRRRRAPAPWFRAMSTHSKVAVVTGAGSGIVGRQGSRCSPTGMGGGLRGAAARSRCAATARDVGRGCAQRLVRAHATSRSQFEVRALSRAKRATDVQSGRRVVQQRGRRLTARGVRGSVARVLAGRCRRR